MEDGNLQITQAEAWSVIDSYFFKKGLVRMQIDSFNEFIQISLQDIVHDSGEFTIDAPNQFGIGMDHSKKLRAHVQFGQVYVTKPTFTEKDGENNNVTPQQARLRNLTYSVQLYADVRIEEEEFNDEKSEWKGLNRADEDGGKQHIGKIPVMLRSEHCVLTTMALDYKGLTDLGECIFDQGGYFVINGSEKVSRAARRRVDGNARVLSAPPPPTTTCLVGADCAGAHEQQSRLLLQKEGRPQVLVGRRVPLPRAQGRAPHVHHFPPNVPENHERRRQAGLATFPSPDGKDGQAGWWRGWREGSVSSVGGMSMILEVVFRESFLASFSNFPGRTK